MVVVQSVKQLKTLLSSPGFDVNAQDPKNKRTVLMSASLGGKSDIVKFLLEETNANSSIPEIDGYLPPDGAAFQGRPEVMRELISHNVNVQYFHKDGNSPFHRACWGKREGHTEVVRILLEHGVDPNLSSMTHSKRRSKICRQMTTNLGTLQLLDEWERVSKEGGSLKLSEPYSRSSSVASNDGGLEFISLLLLSVCCVIVYYVCKRYQTSKRNVNKST